MRTLIKASHSRLLVAGASVLLAVSALAVAIAAAPAQALTPTNIITLNAVGGQATEPLSTPVDLLITATETNTTATLAFSVTGLPAGLTTTPAATPTGATLEIAGTITAPGVYSVTVTATDDLPAANTAAETFAWTAGDFPVTVPATATATHGTAITPVTASAAGGTGPYTYAAPSLPPGLTIDKTTGTISGTPTGTAGVYPVAVTVTDSTAAIGTALITWTVANKITVTAKAPRKVYLRVKVSLRPTATDSDKTQKLTWSVSPASPLPPGLSISKTTGLISGRPQRLAAPPTTVIATDAAGSTGSTVIHWVVSVDGYLDNPGTQTLTAGQGKDLVLRTVDYVPGDKVTWTAKGLPAGMGFAPGDLMLYGWPAAAGTHRVTLTGHGSLGTFDTMTFTLVVKPATGKGATGQLHLALNGKCLQDPGGKTANGTAVTIANCAAGASERWALATDGTIRTGGRCLDIAGTSSTLGEPLRLWTCDGSSREVWAQGSDGKLISSAFGSCVTDPAARKKNGAVPVMGGCRVKSSEQWTLPAHPVLTAVGGSCADDPLSQGTNGIRIDMFVCNGTQGQTWSFRPDGTIRAGLFGSKCVTARGTRIELQACSAKAKGEKWTMSRLGAMSSELSTGGVCLAIPSLTAKNAARLVTAKCTASDPRVHWHSW